MFSNLFSRDKKKQNIKALWQKGEQQIRKGNISKAQELLLEAASSPSILDRHYAYIKLIRLYQHEIEKNPHRLTDLKDICKKDIDMFPDFCEAWMVEYLNNVPTPYFPSFSVLAEIYENEGKIQEAISICELALGYGIQETEGESLISRLERLQKK